MPQISDVSNLPAIFDAVYAIAQGVAGIDWSATYQGLWPANEDIRTYPTLVVPYPEFAAFGFGGKPVGNTSVEGSQVMELFHDCDVFCVAPYVSTDPNTWRIPMQAKGLIERAFRANRTLNTTCTNSRLKNPHLVEFTDRANPALRFFGCRVTIEIYEQVLTPDS